MWLFILILGVIIVAVAVSLHNQSERGKNITTISSDIEKNGFVVSKKINDTENNYALLVDDNNKKWAIVNAKTSTFKIFEYSELVEYEIFEDGDSVVKGRVGSTIVGGALFGGLGALAGASRSKKVKKTCKSMQVRIIVNDIKLPQYNITLVKTETKKDSFIYKAAQTKAQEFASVLAIIKSNAEDMLNLKADGSSISPAEEIKKYKTLMDEGIITQEEFNAKKMQLLNI